MTPFNKTHPLRIVTLCSGYDSQCLALKYLQDQHPDFAFDLIAWSEIEPSAIQAHNLLFPEYRDRNLGYMARIDWSKVPHFDFLTYSTPCQSVSTAGLRKGIAEGKQLILWYQGKPIIGTMIAGIWYQVDISGDREQLLFQRSVTHVSFLPKPQGL